MKLIFCVKCLDIVVLKSHRRKCLCGHISGKYLKDMATVQVSKDAMVLMIDNKKFCSALLSMYKGTGDNPDKSAYFEAYVAPRKGCHKVRGRMYVS